MKSTNEEREKMANFLRYLCQELQQRWKCIEMYTAIGHTERYARGQVRGLIRLAKDMREYLRV